MRVIKFKVVDRAINHMMYPAFDLEKYLNYRELKQDGLAPQNIGEIVLLQFTGLKDKNGKEIYEGATIKAQHGYVEYFGEVVFDVGSFCLKVNNSSEGYGGHAPGYVKGQTPELNNFEIIEVIGNIYETPELLKE